MGLRCLKNGINLCVVSAYYAAVFDHDKFATVLRDQILLVGDVEIELGL